MVLGGGLTYIETLGMCSMSIGRDLRVISAKPPSKAQQILMERFFCVFYYFILYLIYLKIYDFNLVYCYF